MEPAIEISGARVQLLVLSSELSLRTGGGASLTVTLTLPWRLAGLRLTVAVSPPERSPPPEIIVGGLEQHRATSQWYSDIAERLSAIAEFSMMTAPAEPPHCALRIRMRTNPASCLRLAKKQKNRE